MENRNKFILYSLFLIMAFLFSVSLVSASLDTAQMNLKFINPINATTISGRTAFILNVTNATPYEFSTTNLTLYNCTFLFRSTSTANSSWTIVRTDARSETSNNGTIGNETDGWFVTQTVNLTQLEDANNYQFNSSCRTINSTATSQVSNITSMASSPTIIIDYDIPQTPSSISPSAGTRNRDGIVNFTATVTESNTTGCNLSIKTSGAPSYTVYGMTHSANQCWYNHASLDSQTWDFFISAEDGSNITNSSMIQMQVDKDKGTSIYITDEKGKIISTGALAVSTGTGEAFGIPLMGWVFILLIIAGVIVYLFRGKTYYSR